MLSKEANSIETAPPFSGTDSIFNISVKFGGFLKAKEVALERIGGIPGVFL
jgi:hypothetical protein